MMREGCVLTSCLHSGPIPLAHVLEAESRPAWLETETDLAPGTVARVLNALCREYGSCGVMVLDGGQVIGKARVGPTEICDDQPFCVQQLPDRLSALSTSALPPMASLGRRALSILCLQLAEGGTYFGRGIGGEMVRQVVAWARSRGWDEIRAKATRHIPPLLHWTGLLSVDAYDKLGFTCVGLLDVDLLDGVRSMRAGHHGDDVLRQWEPFEHLSDEEAAAVYELVLRFP